MESCVKRAFSLLLGFVLVLSLVPATAFATQTDTEIQASAAVNASTGAVYAAVSEACDEAEAGQTVRLNCDYTEDTVVVDEGVTLDLAGHTLEVDYMVCYGAIIDSSEGTNGLLTVPSNHLILENTNPQLPVKVGEGYHFVEIIGYNTAMVNENKYAFQPLFEADAHQYLAAGTVATGVTIQVDVSWLQGGQEPHAKFAYSDDLLTGYINSYKPATGKYGKMFTLTKQSTGYYRNLGFEAAVVSDTQVQIGAGVTYPQGKIEVDSDNKLVNDFTVKNPQGDATIQAGTRLEDASAELKLTTTKLDSTDTDITLSNGEEMQSFDVHVSGIAKDNTVPVIITLDKLAPEFLNKGNLSLYHVENGATMPMTRVYTLEEVDAHNEYYYDIATGTVTLAMATFSEVATVSDTENGWNGDFDYSWYDPDAAEYVIANADQLAAFGAIVGGMDGQTRNSFAGKTVKLIADINVDDAESDNDSTKIFYPIGYNSSDGEYEKTGVAISSSLKTFEGIFDGQGHTISNIYQNTWEMKGDHDWYSPEEQYYRDGMGLFGRVYKGTVKNLNIKNFTSDGEIATTGCVAAYADGATFENIAIFNCNPRVYNIGNGGIVGCVGWYAKEADLKTTFKNITVDNSNKISALWGSYDVPCGGIVGQYYCTSGQTSAGTPKNAGIYLENCHVSAIMDVHNDVCANYQYYAYRYAGILIGSVSENETINGHVYPKMDGITASGCTVHFGTWNDYYYCEIIDNTTASYTHDYQMSRLTEIKAINGTTVTYLDDTTGTVPASGRANYVIVDYTKGHGTENATCYHFKDGAVWTHDMGGIQTGIDENKDGKDDLKEDKQHIYLEFNNLITGYGWGVTTKAVGDMAGVTILDRQEANSVVKFESTVTELENNKECKLGDIFSFVNNGVEVVPNALTIAVENLDESNPVSATFVRDDNNWENGAITFTGTGKIKLTIQDYYFCTPTTINVTITERQPEQKFNVVMNNGDFLHRVGNQGTVALSKLFSAKDGATIGVVSVTIETVDGTGATGTYANNAIQFSGTGVVKITITDNDFCTPTELYLEVVDATNVTGLSGTISGNVVLLNNCGISSLTVSGRNTVYGNGFTATYSGNGQYLNNGLKQGVIMVSDNGTLDNLRIKASIYPFAYMYYGVTALGDYVQGGPVSTETASDGTVKNRYHYQLSAVAVSDSATITNCYIYGGRTNVFVDTGNVTIQDSVLECGTVANVQIQSTSDYTVTLENVTTIQYQVDSNVAGTTAQKMLGAGVLVGPDTTSNPAITLNGEFKQYNWVNAEDSEAVSGEMAKLIVNGALDATAYNHVVNGKTASNLGIVYMNTEDAQVTNNTGLPYVLSDVALKYANNTVDGQVCSLQGATAEQIYSDYANADKATVNGDYLPTFKFDLGDQELSFEGSEDARYMYGDENGVIALYQDGTDPLTLDLTKVASVYKYTGKPYDVTGICKDSAGNAMTSTNGIVTLVAQGEYTLEFTVDDNVFYNQNGETITKSVTRTFTVPLSLTVKEANIPNATVEITKTALDGVYTTVNITDYKLRINFLDCISVTDYDNTGAGTAVNLSSNITSVALTPSGVNVFTTAFTATVTYTDGRVLTVNFSKISGSSPGTKTATVNTSGGVYFITDGALNNKPTEASSQNICTITSVSFKGNSGSTVTNDTDVTITWELESSGSGGGCVTPETLITLADGTQKRVDALTGDELLLVWNLETGKYEAVPIVFVDSEEEAEYEIIHLHFSDGSDVKVIYEHGFFDLDLGKYVYIDAYNYSQYIGHRFVTQGDLEANNWNVVTLDNVVIDKEVTTAWSPVTSEYLCYYTNGVLSMPGGISGLFNIFDVNTETMSYDAQKKAQDIETYGLFTLEDFGGLITQEAFDAFNGAYLKVAMGKGLLTWEDIAYMAERYIPLM